MTKQGCGVREKPVVKGEEEARVAEGLLSQRGHAHPWQEEGGHGRLPQELLHQERVLLQQGR